LEKLVAYSYNLKVYFDLVWIMNTYSFISYIDCIKFWSHVHVSCVNILLFYFFI